MAEDKTRRRLRRMRLLNIVLIGVIIGFTASTLLFQPFSSNNSEESAAAGLLTAEDSEGREDHLPYVDTRTQPRGEQTMEFAQRLEHSFNQVVDTVLPAVVELRVTERITQQFPQGFDFFPWFFGTPRDQFEEREYEANSLGSGFLFQFDEDTSTYYLLTNNHVAGRADSISVVMTDGTIYDNAELIGANERRDLAVVTFTSEEEYPVVTLGDSDELKVGDWVLAMGSPYGYISSVTSGIVSALGRSGRDVDNISDFIQTDAAINQGNSGGPLVNIHGEVVGINTWIAAPTGGNIGLGFSIPINNVKQVVNDLIVHGDVQDGWLGISMLETENLPDDFPEVYTDTRGVFINNVYLDSPAYKSGLRPGDIVTRFNNRDIAAADELSRQVGNASVSETHRVTVLRSGEEKILEVELEVRQQDEQIREMRSQLWPAVMPMPLTDEIREDLRISEDKQGVMIYFPGETRGTKFYSAGLRNLDVVTSINNEPVATVEDFYRFIGDDDVKELSIRFLRDGSEFFVGVVR